MRVSGFSERLSSDLKGFNGVCLVISQEKDYPSVVQAIAEQMVKLGLTGLCVLLDIPVRLLVQRSEVLRSSGKISFIDGITNIESNPDLYRNLVNVPNCVFLKSLSLAELSLAINERLSDESVDFVLFDSLTTLSSENDFKTTLAFADYLFRKIRSLGKTGVFTCVIPDSEAGKLVLLRGDPKMTKRIVRELKPLCTKIMTL